MSNGERLLQINGVELCIETFGNDTDPAILLIHGASASMLWWDEELCDKIAAHGRFVIRFDNRDTGRSVSYPPGQPGYSLTDMADDAIGILDALGVRRAHIVGQSMAGAIAVVIGVDHRERAASLTFIGTTSGDDDLPPMSEEFGDYASRELDFNDPAAVVDYTVGLMKVFCGRSPDFDEPAVRALAERDVARTRNMASALTNPFLIDFDGPVSGGLRDVRVPTLVVHGELDPVFPLPHGEALCKAIPGAKMLILERAGHDLPRRLWDEFVLALIGHTAA